MTSLSILILLRLAETPEARLRLDSVLSFIGPGSRAGVGAHAQALVERGLAEWRVCRSAKRQISITDPGRAAAAAIIRGALTTALRNTENCMATNASGQTREHKTL